MDSKLELLSPKVYTDIQGLREIKYSKDTSGAKKEVAQQFEAILMQMVMGSMRQANKAFASGLFGSNAMDMYQDLFDKQMSLVMSQDKNGFAALIEKSIDQMQGNKAEPPTDSMIALKPLPHRKEVSVPSQFDAMTSVDNRVQGKQAIENNLKAMEAVNNSRVNTLQDKSVASNAEEIAQQKTFNSPEDFVKKLWDSAKYAAHQIGSTPEFLLAQAALETNWGKNIISDAKSLSTHNLFNIKAGSSWFNKSVAVETLEQKQDVIVKEKAHFRSYESYKDSFLDYVNLLKSHDRYSQSIEKAGNPEEFASALQDAGYATDKNYANKIMKVYNSPLFQGLITKMKSAI